MYLVTSFPAELNDNILLYIGSLDLAVQSKRYWVASKLIDVNTFRVLNLSENILKSIIHYLNVEKKNHLNVIASRYGNYKLVKHLFSDPRIDPAAQDNEAIR